MSDIKNTTYIFRNLKVYSSIEWLADNKKKYRSVFDKNDVSYIYAEFSFFNLNFKKKDWDLKLEVVCRDQNKNEICRLNCDRTISQNANLIFVREGWGTRRRKSSTGRWMGTSIKLSLMMI